MAARPTSEEPGLERIDSGLVRSRYEPIGRSSHQFLRALRCARAVLRRFAVRGASCGRRRQVTEPPLAPSSVPPGGVTPRHRSGMNVRGRQQEPARNVESGCGPRSFVADRCLWLTSHPGSPPGADSGDPAPPRLGFRAWADASRRVDVALRHVIRPNEHGQIAQNADLRRLGDRSRTFTRSACLTATAPGHGGSRGRVLLMPPPVGSAR